VSLSGGPYGAAAVKGSLGEEASRRSRHPEVDLPKYSDETSVIAQFVAVSPRKHSTPLASLVKGTYRDVEDATLESSSSRLKKSLWLSRQ
jgi:hypothetical protein